MLLFLPTLLEMKYPQIAVTDRITTAIEKYFFVLNLFIFLTLKPQSPAFGLHRYIQA